MKDDSSQACQIVINNFHRTWTELTKTAKDNSLFLRGLKERGQVPALTLSVWAERLDCTVKAPQESPVGENLQLSHPLLKNLGAWDIT